MISKTLQVAMLIAIIIYFACLLHFLRKRRLNLKYTLLWIISGALMLLLALFPQLLTALASLVGVYEPTNALFAVLCFCIIMILMSLTAIVSKQSEHIKRLTQSIALLEDRMQRFGADYKREEEYGKQNGEEGKRII